MEEEFKLSKDELLKLANSSALAKEILFKKYPNAFDDSVEIEFKDNRYSDAYSRNGLIAIRDSGKYKQKGFWLNPSYNWNFKDDSNNSIILVPTKRI